MPTTCADLGKSCGNEYSDGCGGALGCGSCAEEETCDDGICLANDPYPVESWITGTIQNDATGVTLCTEGSTVSSGATMTISPCSSTLLRQNWTLTRGGQLKNVKTERCVEPAGEVAGAVLAQQPCSLEELQQWKLGNMEIVNGLSGECLDVPAAEYLAGKELVSWACHGGQNQKLSYDPESREIRIQGFCLAGGSESGSAVKLAHCDGSDAQGWNAARGGFTSRGDASLCLSVDDDASVVLSSCDDSIGQMWALRGQIEHANDDYCLSAGAEGGELTLASCDASSSQQRLTFWSSFGCTPTTCAELGASCGTIADDCGGSVECGSCGAGQECGASHSCQEECEESDEDFCARTGSACGLTVADDVCGEHRSVECGDCQEGGSCSDNACAAPPAESDAGDEPAPEEEPDAGAEPDPADGPALDDEEDATDAAAHDEQDEGSITAAGCQCGAARGGGERGGGLWLAGLACLAALTRRRSLRAPPLIRQAAAQRRRWSF